MEKELTLQEQLDEANKKIKSLEDFLLLNMTEKENSDGWRATTQVEVQDLSNLTNKEIIELNEKVTARFNPKAKNGDAIPMANFDEELKLAEERIENVN